MEANAGMEAGSQKRSEFVTIQHEGEDGVCSFLTFLSDLVAYYKRRKEKKRLLLAIFGSCS